MRIESRKRSGKKKKKGKKKIKGLHEVGKRYLRP
jgi:hypothetical protein